jgi:hypothetical protein
LGACLGVFVSVVAGAGPRAVLTPVQERVVSFTSHSLHTLHEHAPLAHTHSCDLAKLRCSSDLQLRPLRPLRHVCNSLALSTYSLAHCARPPSRDRKFTHTHANPSRQADWIASSLTRVCTSQLSSVPTPVEPSRRRQKRTLRPWPCSTARRFEHCGVIAAPRYTRASVPLPCETFPTTGHTL